MNGAGLLTDDEQVLLRRLSVFGGGFNLRAVEEVSAREALAPSMMLDCLGRLVDKSMVQVEHSAARSGIGCSWIRQFGRERLIAAETGRNRGGALRVLRPVGR